MGKHFVFADQRGSSDLRHHETRVQTRFVREKWRQAFVEGGIHEPFDPSFRNSSKSAQRNSQEIEREGDWLAMKIAAREHVGVICCGTVPGRTGLNAYSQTIRGGEHKWIEIGRASCRERV